MVGNVVGGVVVDGDDVGGVVEVDDGLADNYLVVADDDLAMEGDDLVAADNTEVAEEIADPMVLN